VVLPSLKPLRDKFNLEVAEDVRRHKSGEVAVYDWRYHPEDGRLIQLPNSPKVGKEFKNSATGRTYDIYREKGFIELTGDALLQRVKEQQDERDRVEAARLQPETKAPQPQQHEDQLGRRGGRHG